MSLLQGLDDPFLTQTLKWMPKDKLLFGGPAAAAVLPLTVAQFSIADTTNASYDCSRVLVTTNPGASHQHHLCYTANMPWCLYLAPWHPMQASFPYTLFSNKAHCRRLTHRCCITLLTSSPVESLASSYTHKAACITVIDSC